LQTEDFFGRVKLRLLLLYRLWFCEAVARSNLRPFFVPAERIHRTQPRKHSPRGDSQQGTR